MEQGWQKKLVMKCYSMGDKGVVRSHAVLHTKEDKRTGLIRPWHV